jgi:hypothetical protein
MESMQLFAFWKNIPTNRATGNSNDPLQLPLQRDRSIEMDALLFIVDIPEETRREEVRTRAFPYVDASRNFEGETLESGFYEEWPRDIRDEFRYADSDLKRSWARL